MRIRRWPGTEPADCPETLFLTPLMGEWESSSKSPKHYEMRDWLRQSKWTKDEPQAIIISVGGWQSYQAHNLLCDDNGQVTHDSIARHIHQRMSGWNRVLNWWVAYLQTIANEGYEIGLVQMDIEGCLLTTGWKYDLHFDGVDAISMMDVIGYMYEHPKYCSRLPNLDLEALTAPEPNGNVYGEWLNEFAMLTWNHEMIWRNSRAFDKYFAEPAKMIFPDCITTNYNFNNYQRIPLMTKPHRHPQVDAGVDNNSAPVLYLSGDTNYNSNRESYVVLDSIRDMSRTCPWVGASHRNRNGWNQSERQYREQLAEIEGRGCPWAVIF